MLADLGMVKTYSKSAHVNDLGFAWTGPPCCMDRLAPLFAWTSAPPCSYNFSARWFCNTLQVHTAPSLHLPLFLEETFLHTLVSPLFMECKLHMGQSTFKASKQQWQQRGIAWTGPPCCMDRLPPPPPSLHGPALLLVPTIFPPGGFAIPCRYTLHHPYPRGSTIDTLMCLW